MRNLTGKILLVLASLLAFSAVSMAQFKEEAFSQTYNDDTAPSDSVDQMWSFKEYFRGLSHKDSLRIGSMFAGSTVFIGGEQIYNKQYWKLPIVYGGLGATIGYGIYNRRQFNITGEQRYKDMSTYMFAGAGLIYWATLFDGVYNYNRDVPHQPGKATLYAILFPGLGQIYNGEYWKVPIYWGALTASVHYWSVNNTQYQRYKRIHNEATAENSTYDGLITAERALYYRDVFRRWRDYSMVAIIGSYLLQVIDANVFSYMRDFEVTDDLSLKVAPTVIAPETYYALNPGYGAGMSTNFVPAVGISNSNALGLKVGLTF